MQNACATEDPGLPFAEWKTERLHSWKEIACFFRKEVRTVQLWEKHEGLPVRRQHHKKLGSVYAYRRELESWWVARSKLSAHAAHGQVTSDGGAKQHTAEIREAERWRILVFPIEVVHSQRERGPLQQIVKRFADGLREDLMVEFSRSELNRKRFDLICLAADVVPSHGTSTPGFMRNTAREFGAECYLTGAVRYAGGMVRVSMQLVRSEDFVCLWSERFDRTLDSLFRAQVELAHDIVRALPELKSTHKSAEQRACSAQQSPAYHACMTGFYFWNQRTETDLLKALGYFQDAILIDPSCAEAYAGLADTYASLSYHHFIPARQAIEAAQSAVDMALRLDPKSAKVRNAEINFRMNCTWDWRAADRACQEVVRSNSVDARALQLYSSLMISRGRHDEAISLALHAQRLDPHSDGSNSQVSFAYFYAGDYDRAISSVERTIALKPLFHMGHALLGRAEAQRANWDRAIQSFEQGLLLSGESIFLKALLAYGYAGRGDAPAANGLLDEIEERCSDACFPAVDVSGVYAMLNQHSKALENIGRAYELRDMKLSYVQYDPRFSRLRESPEFRKIASSVCACRS